VNEGAHESVRIGAAKGRAQGGGGWGRKDERRTTASSRPEERVARTLVAQPSELAQGVCRWAWALNTTGGTAGPRTTPRMLQHNCASDQPNLPRSDKGPCDCYEPDC
jgi:hypothetical protein